MQRSFFTALRQTRFLHTTVFHSTRPAFQTETGLTPAESALQARLNLTFSPDVFQQVLRHMSHNHARDATNERLEFLGRKVMSLYVTEHIHLKYPVLPILAVKDTLDAYCNVKSLAKVGREWGLQNVVRWNPTPTNNAVAQDIGRKRVVGKTVLSIVGAIYHEHGALAAREFVHQHILTRDVPIESILNVQMPKRVLSALMKRKAMQPPISRLIRESGRKSNAPLFVVGVYSGSDKLGEGFGSSIKMAEHRAAKDALMTYYLSEVKDFALPSDMEAAQQEEDGMTFMAQPLGDTRVVL
jgi:large subunit ribosomal protein L44